MSVSHVNLMNFFFVCSCSFVLIRKSAQFCEPHSNFVPEMLVATATQQQDVIILSSGKTKDEHLSQWRRLNAH